MILDVATESGSKYAMQVNEHGQVESWVKLGGHELWHTLKQLHVRFDSGWALADLPSIGCSMHISGIDGVWWLSTPVTSITARSENQ